MVLKRRQVLNNGSIDFSVIKEKAREIDGKCRDFILNYSRNNFSIANLQGKLCKCYYPCCPRFFLRKKI